MRETIEKWLDRCETVLLYVAVLATFVMMCLTTADAAGRYLFNRPIAGAYEVTEKYLMVAMVFLGVCYAYRGGAYIRVTFLVDHLPRAVKIFFDYLAQIFSIVYGIILVVATAQQYLRVASDRMTLSAVDLPIAPAYLIVPVGLFFMSVLMLLDLPRVRRGESLLFKDESPIL
jgi:TRAP-type C4-dicarboxylate transport system permease small subunit